MIQEIGRNRGGPVTLDILGDRLDKVIQEVNRLTGLVDDGIVHAVWMDAEGMHVEQTAGKKTGKDFPVQG